MKRYIVLFAVFLFAVSSTVAQAREAKVVAEDIFQHIITPGNLHPSHAHLQGVSRCGACHSMTSGVSEEKCLQCHQEISQRVQATIGYHGSFSKSCLKCHTGHADSIIRFEQKSFNHKLSQFPLTGKHATVGCEKCHRQPRKKGTGKRFTYLGLARECGGCHQNIHVADNMGKCQSCHATTGWHLHSFSHGEKTAYPLQGLHKIVPCQKCHPKVAKTEKDPVQFKVAGHQSCLACHKDTHKGKLGTDCLSCHTMNGWRGRNVFDHDKARFKLVGKHQGVKCGQCHKKNRFKGLPFADCSDCHQGKTAHKNRIEGCGNCHSSTSWLALNPDWQDDRVFHQKLPYQLQGAHQKVACAKCHSNNGVSNYFNLNSADCRSCHADPHKGELQGACQRCHVVTSFKDHTRFDHQQASFMLDTRHAKIECTTCHRLKSFKHTPSACGDCHLDITRFSRGIWGERWRERRLISPKARIVACRDCHTFAMTGKVTGETCLSCHGTTYKVFFRTRVSLATAAIAALRQKYTEVVACVGHDDPVLSQIPERLNFIEKNFYHNYRLADQALTDMAQQLSEVDHANCQE